MENDYVSGVSGYYRFSWNLSCGKYSSSCSFDRRSLCSKSQVKLVISSMQDCLCVFFIYHHHIWNNELGSHKLACPSQIRGVLVLLCYTFLQVVQVWVDGHLLVEYLCCSLVLREFGVEI